jgi:hypothetical protein
MGCSTGGGRREQILDKQERRGYDFCYMEVRLFQESRRGGIDPSAALWLGLRGETKNGAKSLKTNNPRIRRNESGAKPLKTNNPAKCLIRRS